MFHGWIFFVDDVQHINILIKVDVKRDGDTKDMVDVKSDCRWLVCVFVYFLTVCTVSN